MTSDQPWPPRNATDEIRALANDDEMSLILRRHAKERMLERDLIMSDLLHVLKHGFVYASASDSTQEGQYKYAIENNALNGDGRNLRVIVVPVIKDKFLNIVSFMWVDEKQTRAGTVLGEYEDE
ncbi:MAG: DUF4258 domain-containing protein [Alphaproteobacteria bacterium]